MSESIGGATEVSSVGSLATRAFSERDLAHGVTSWMVSNFGPQLTDAIHSTPFTVPLRAIACREVGMYWLPLTPHKSAAEILGLSVYDASGDVAGAPRNAFPINTAQFRLAFGDAFTAMLVDEANKARAARGLSPAAIVYKGYGIFQYDLQFVRSDENFFKAKQWYSFAECLSRAVKELKTAFARTGDIQDAVCAYNGSGPSAEQYARDVMRILPFCEEAAVAPAAPMAASGRPGVSALAAPGAGAPGPIPDDDPAAPREGEITETADLATARVLANLGAPGAVDVASAAAPPSAAAAGPALLLLNIGIAKAFLDACMTSTPRVRYGLGKKVPFLHAVPGRDFTQVDCSGFVREAIRLSTSPSAPFPDGSVVQHDWVRSRGFERTNIAAGRQDDGTVRIAFLRPQDSGEGIGHVVLIAAGKTLESRRRRSRCSGVGWQLLAGQGLRIRDGARNVPRRRPQRPRTVAVDCSPRADVHGSSRQALPGDLGAEPVRAVCRERRGCEQARSGRLQGCRRHRRRCYPAGGRMLDRAGYHGTPRSAHHERRRVARG
jgi:hypothetical protein